MSKIVMIIIYLISNIWRIYSTTNTPYNSFKKFYLRGENKTIYTPYNSFNKIYLRGENKTKTKTITTTTTTTIYILSNSFK